MDTLDSTKPTTISTLGKEGTGISATSSELAKQAEKETRTFKLVHPDGTETGTYRGANPRNAAIKAARKLTGTKEKPVELKLREHGDHLRLHVFSGYTAMVKAPAKHPAWMNEVIKQAFVKKLRVERIPQKGD